MKFIERDKHALNSKWLGDSAYEVIDWYDGPLSAIVKDEFGDKFLSEGKEVVDLVLEEKEHDFLQGSFSIN